MSGSQDIALSASVILLRPGSAPDHPFELYLLRRAGSSRFMPGRYVFPGGRLEPEDGPLPPSQEALKTCALRELWEEAGVCLARPLPKAAPPAWPQIEAARAGMLAGEAVLALALAALGLEPDLKALTPYARWITPKARPRRFDTTFFLAQMPAGQTASSDEAETTEGLWVSPAQALSQNQEGRVALAPPQVRILGELSAFAGRDDLLAAAQAADLTPVMPKGHFTKTVRTIMLPWDPDYEAGIPTREATPSPAGQCSRLVHTDDRWLPYRAD